MKTCPGCNKEKTDEEFVKNKYKKSGLSCYCKVCKREKDNNYYASNKNRKCGIAERRKKEKEIRINFIKDYLMSHACVDCGNKDIRVLEFDHIGNNKSFNLNASCNKSMSEIKEEILKCEVRCSNCHRIRHYTELNSWRCS